VIMNENLKKELVKRARLRNEKRKLDTEVLKAQQGRNQITSIYPHLSSPMSLGGTNTVQGDVKNIRPAQVDSLLAKELSTVKDAIPVDIETKDFKLEPKHWNHNKGTSTIEANVPCGKIIFTLMLKNGILNEVDVTGINLRMTSATLDPPTQVYQTGMRVRVIYSDGRTQDSTSIVSIKASDMLYFYKEFGKGTTKYIDRSKYKKWECYHMTDDNGNPLPKDTCDVCKCVR